MTQTETWTVGRLLTWTTDYLKQRGVEDSPRLDAEVLLATARGCKRIDLYAAFTEPASEETRTAFKELVRRRAEGTPVAYLVGKREFYSLDFRVSPAVLIPRPETEHLVITLLDRLKERESKAPVQIADVGTGSGIIAVCIAKHAPLVKVTAIDLSPEALAIAKKNISNLGVEEKVETIESDLFAAVPADRTFDFVVSNPPYITTAEMETLAPTVKQYEPAMALHAGPAGTEIIERLIDESAGRLTPGGWLMFEISPMLETAVQKLFAARPEWELMTTVKDLAGLARVIQAQYKKKD